MTIQYRDVPYSPDYPHTWLGGERDASGVCTGDACRIVAEDGDYVTVEIQFPRETHRVHRRYVGMDPRS